MEWNNRRPRSFPSCTCCRLARVPVRQLEVGHRELHDSEPSGMGLFELWPIGCCSVIDAIDTMDTMDADATDAMIIVGTGTFFAADLLSSC